MKVLGFIQGSGPDLKSFQYYRVYLPMREVGKNTDIEVVQVDATQPLFFNNEQTEGYDFYAMSRMYGGDSRAFVDAVHATGAKITWDCDDDLTDDVRWVSGHGDAVKEMLGAVDFVTVTTPVLAERLGRYTQRAPVVIPNYVDGLWLQEQAASVQRFVPGLTLGFAGTKSHWGDFHIALDAFRSVSEQPHVQPLLLGYHPPYFDDIPGIVRINQVPLAGYPGMLGQFDVLCCCLDTEEPGPAWKPEYEIEGNYQWNEGKSAVKALEAMALGIVALCSDIPAYRALYEAGAPIVLVENAEDWSAEVAQIVGDAKLRETLSAAGPEWIAANRDMRNDGWKVWADYLRGL